MASERGKCWRNPFSAFIRMINSFTPVFALDQKSLIYGKVIRELLDHSKTDDPPA